MTSAPQLLQNDVRLSIEAYRSDAVDHVLKVTYERHPELFRRFGERGRRLTRDDTHHHLDYLEGALIAGNDPAILENYVIWLKDLLTSRGVPSMLLSESFELLIEFFRTRMSAADFETVHTLLAAAVSSLENDKHLSPYVQLRLPALPAVAEFRDVSLSGLQREALAIMNSVMNEGASLTKASVQLVQPAMYDIGRLWQNNRVTVAQEHLATAVAQNVLARSYMNAHFLPSNGRKAAFAGIEGNQHSLGLRILADAFETKGWTPSFLGTDVPTNDLLKQIDADSPELLCLSLSLPQHLAAARSAIAQLRADLGSRCPTIWVGGQVTMQSERAWAQVNADGWAADALHALEQVDA